MPKDAKGSGQAVADAGTDDLENVVSGQAGEPGTDEAGKGTGENLYTPEELEAIHPMEYDLERVPPEALPFVKKTIEEYKKLQKTFTKATQDIAELRKAPPEPERYFDEETKNSAFKQYLKSPSKFVSEINAAITKLEDVDPDDREAYKQARKHISYYQGVKDEFALMRQEISDKKRDEELADARIQGELGNDAEKIRDFARTELGFSTKDFNSNPKIREAAKKLYEVANAGLRADGKAVKTTPQKTAGTSGTASGEGAKAKPSTKELMEEAKKTGDFYKVFKATGVL